MVRGQTRLDRFSTRGKRALCCSARLDSSWPKRRVSYGCLGHPKSTLVHAPSLAQPLACGLGTKARWHWSGSAVLREFISRFRKQSMWNTIIQRNEWFEERAAKLLHRLLQSGVAAPPMVFSYSYAALRIFEVAKSYGCQCVLGQIDPGPEEQRLVERLHKNYGGDQLEFPPDSYWSRWRQECELADKIVVNSDWSSRLLEGELSQARSSMLYRWPMNPKESLVLERLLDRKGRCQAHLVKTDHLGCCSSGK